MHPTRIVTTASGQAVEVSPKEKGKELFPSTEPPRPQRPHHNRGSNSIDNRLKVLGVHLARQMMRSSEPLPIAPSLPREAIQLEAPAQASPTNRPGRKIAQLGGRSIHQLFKYLKTVYSETIQTHLAAKAKKEAQRKALLLELTTEMHALIIKPENTSSVDSLEQNFFKVFPRWAEIHQTLSRKEEDVKIATEDRIRLKKAEKTLSEFLTETNRLKSPGQTEFFTLKHFSLEEDWNLNYQEEVDFFIWVCCLLPKDLTHLDLSELPLHPVTIKRIKESLPNCKVTAKSKLTIDTA